MFCTDMFPASDAVEKTAAEDKRATARSNEEMVGLTN